MKEAKPLRQGRYYVWIVWTGKRWELRAIVVDSEWRPVKDEPVLAVTDEETLLILDKLYQRPDGSVQLKGFETVFLQKFPLGWFVTREENVALPRFTRMYSPRVRNQDAAACMMEVTMRSRPVSRKGDNKVDSKGDSNGY